jgi:hypothetical protein
MFISLFVTLCVKIDPGTHKGMHSVLTLKLCVIGFKAQTGKPSPLVLRPNQENSRHWFWGSTKKPALLLSTCIVQTAHSATQPLNRPAIEYPTYATILDHLHQVSYSCHDSHHCMPCRTYHVHTMRQANTILQMKQRIKVKLPKCPGFEFKLGMSMTHHISNKGTNHLVSQSPHWWVHWQQKIQSLNLESKTSWSTVRRLKANEKLKKVV